VLPGGVGRTDLLGADRAAELATAQWHSARRLLTELDEGTTVLPTHGFGSFCSATPKGDATMESVTIAVEHVRNIAMQMTLEDFVASLCHDVPPIPAYYRYMAPINRKGPSAPNFGPLTRIDQATLDRFLAAGGAVADLRPRRLFAGAHWRGALNIELGSNLTTYFGWLLAFEAPYLLIAGSVDDVEQSRRLLARIDREATRGYALAEDLDPERAQQYRVASFSDLARTIADGDDPYVVDVRHQSEWRAAHLVGAHHVSLPDLARERPTLPRDSVIWVHCAAGFRAAVAASQLSAWGYFPVLVDDMFDHAATSGLAVVTGE
jgi:rhodanese-related sulfurtransferase